MNKELMRTAKKLSFAHDDEVIYGEIEGYVTTVLEQTDNTKEIFINLFTNSQTCENIQNALYNNENRRKFNILNADCSENHVSILIAESSEKTKNLYAFCDWFFPYLRSLGVLGSNCCSKCKQQINGSEKVYNIIRNRAYTFHGYCAQRTTPRLTDDYAADVVYEKEKKESSNLGRGTIGALLGGLLGATIWALIYSLGFYSTAVGVLIGFTAIVGYLKFGGPNEPVIFLVIIPTVMLYILFGQYLGICLDVWFEFSKADNNEWSLINLIQLQNNLLITDMKYRSEFIREYFVCLGYSVVGAIVYAVISLRRSKT